MKFIMQTKFSIALLCLFLLTCSLSSALSLASTIAADDNYLAGYVQGIFVSNYGLSSSAVLVRDGIIIINKNRLNGQDPDLILEKTKQLTSSLQGVKGVIVVSNHAAIKVKEQYSKITLPNHSLFEPLIADPKWPRFTVAYQYFFRDKDLKVRQAFAPNFGASFALCRIVNNETESEWEVGMQAGLFGLINIGVDPTALINADYFVGVPITYKSGPWSSIIKPYHLSAHLGDEFMLTPQGKKTHRINLSYEGIDALLSYHFNNFRVYGGGGYLVFRDPSYIKPLKIQVGAEYYSDTTYFNGRLRPVMGLDIKAEQLAKWYPGISYKAGVQVENASLISNKVQFMLEFYSGKSMHGQFYNDKIRYIGFGIQAFL